MKTEVFADFFIWTYFKVFETRSIPISLTMAISCSCSTWYILSNMCLDNSMTKSFYVYFGHCWDNTIWQNVFFFLQCRRYNTFHFNLMVHFQNCSLLPKLKWLNGNWQLLNKAMFHCFKLSSFVSRFHDWVGISNFHVLIFSVFGLSFGSSKLKNISTWKKKRVPKAWKFSILTSHPEKYHYIQGM